MKIRFIAKCAIPDHQLAMHRDLSRSAGLPSAEDRPAGGVLAVVGGGVSAVDHIETLKNYVHVWAINGTHDWCQDQGIDVTFFTIDPHQQIAGLVKRVKRAVLADCVHPDVFHALRDRDVRLVRTGVDAIKHASTSASTAPMIAAHCGFSEVHLFGCESSFGEQTHIYKNDPLNRIWVKCDGKEYVTCSQFLMQAEFLAELIRSLNGYVKTFDDGFLSALVRSGDYSVTHTSHAIKEALENAARSSQTSGDLE